MLLEQILEKSVDQYVSQCIQVVQQSLFYSHQRDDTQYCQNPCHRFS